MSFAELEAVLRAIASPDNGLRAQAEQRLGEGKANPTWLVPALLEVAQRSTDAVAAQMSVVLLRRFLSRSRDGLFDQLPPATQGQVKAELLSRVSQPQVSAAIRKGIAHCVSGLACQQLDTWPELLPALSAALQQDSPEVQGAVLTIFTALAPHFNDAQLASHALSLRDMCSFALQRPSVEVKTGAVELATEVVAYLKEERHVAAFQQLLPALVAAVGQALAEANWGAAERSVQAFIGLAEVTPEFFAPHLKDVFAPFLEITAAAGIEASLRRLAFEFTLTLAETDPKAVRRLPQYLSASVPLAMQMLLRVEHTARWAHTAEEAEAEDDDADFAFGVEALDRLALALGGKRTHPVVSPLIMQFLQESDWRHRHAALWALSQVAEGCSREFQPLLPQIAPLITKAMEDPHERVRHAAVTCMAQFCTEFRPEFQAAYHGQFLPLLMQRMTDQPRVASLAAQACINFLEGAEKEHTEPHLDALLTAMLQLLQATPHRFVSEAVVSAVTAVASHAEDLFGKYYDTVVPWLKSVIVAPVVPRPDRMLRAKALECLTRIALAVGKGRFAADASAVLEAMQRMQTANLEADDPGVPYLMRAWGRMAECLGPDMGPYYSVVVPALLAQVQVQTDIVISDEEGQEAEEGVQSVTLSLKGLGDKRISIKTSALEEKALAVAVLEQVLEGGGVALAPFAEALLPPLLPLLRFVYVEEVRDDAASCLPPLLKCIKHQEGREDAQRVAAVAQQLVAALAEAVQREPSSGVKATQLQALSSCIEEGPKNCWGPAVAGDLAALMQKVLADSSAARDRLRLQKRGCDDEDDGEKLDEDIEAEEEVACQALDVTTALLQREAAFLPHWEAQFFPAYARLLNTGLFETRLALCAFSAFLEHHGTGACAPHVAAIAGALLEHCRPDHDDPDVVQTACYGLGAGCLQGPTVAAAFAPTAVQRLAAVVQHRHAAPEWESAVCNAVAALLKAHEGLAGLAGCGTADVLPAVLGAVPVRGDEAEARGAHRRLVQRLARGDANAAGGDRAAALRRLAAVAEGPLLDDETRAALRALA